MVEFENKWFTSVAPGTNSVMSAHYEDPNTAKILAKIENVEAKIENVETKIGNAVTELKSKIYRYRYKGK